MKVALSLSLLMVGSFLIGFYVLSPFFPMENGNQNYQMEKNQSMTKNIPDRIDTNSYNWGWSDDYCLRKLKLKDTSIILIPRCEF